MYIDKVIDKEKGLKKIVTFGQDCLYNEEGVQQEVAYVIKIWDFQQLTSETCKYNKV
jgi:hypothetical protein